MTVRVPETERGSTRSHSVENSLCKRLWTCLKTDCGLNGRDCWHWIKPLHDCQHLKCKIYFKITKQVTFGCYIRPIYRRDPILRKATISFVMSVCPSVRLKELISNWTDFLEIGYWGIFRKCDEKIQVWLKSDKNNGYTKTNIHFLSYLAQLLVEWDVSDRICR